MGRRQTAIHRLKATLAPAPVPGLPPASANTLLLAMCRSARYCSTLLRLAIPAVVLIVTTLILELTIILANDGAGPENGVGPAELDQPMEPPAPANELEVNIPAINNFVGDIPAAVPLMKSLRGFAEHLAQ